MFCICLFDTKFSVGSFAVIIVISILFIWVELKCQWNNLDFSFESLTFLQRKWKIKGYLIF